MKYCEFCDNTGIYQEPKNEDTFNRSFDLYDNEGKYSLGETRKKALNDSGYTIIKPCPQCGKSPSYYTK